MSEFVQATEKLSIVHPAVAVFGSARTKPGHPDYVKAEKIARALSDAGFSVVSGGGPGIMEAVNRGAFPGKSASVGLNISLPHEQSGNPYQDFSHTFQHFFARKVMFVRLAVAHVFMPGGFGTIDELGEVLTLVQTGKTRRVPVILVHRPFWEPMLDWFRDTLIVRGMIDDSDMRLMQVCEEPAEIVDAIFDFYAGRGFGPSPAERAIQLNL